MANQEIVKRSIAEAVKDLVRERSVEEISVSDICERSNVNRRTFYRYFSDKFEVMEWIHYTDFLQKLLVLDKSGQYYYMAEGVNLVLEDRAYYINALKYRGQNSFRQYCSFHLSNLCYSDFRECFNSDEMYYLYFHHAVELTFDFFELMLRREDTTKEMFLKAFRDLFYYPSKQYVALLGQEYNNPQEGLPYETAEPSRAPKKGK